MYIYIYVCIYIYKLRMLYGISYKKADAIQVSVGLSAL